jgi:hypothetical protein
LNIFDVPHLAPARVERVFSAIFVLYAHIQIYLSHQFLVDRVYVLRISQPHTQMTILDSHHEKYGFHNSETPRTLSSQVGDVTKK